MPQRPSLSTPATLVATGLAAERGGRHILRGVSLAVSPRDRVGVVGPNGSGKSTLLAVLAGRLARSAGRVELQPPQATVGLLAQEHDRMAGEVVRELLAREVGAAGAEAALADAAAALGSGSGDAEVRYAVALERWLALGVDTFAARSSSVLGEVGLDEGVLDRPVPSLSGGERAKVALAAVLLSRFDVLLLDEPTNDLDFTGLELLERFVLARAGGLVVVSHDRSFLERTVTSVLEIDEHDGSARHFDGGWSAFLEERRTQRRHAEEEHAKYRSSRAKLLDRARREREWATSGARREKRRPQDSDKIARSFRLNRTEKLAARARMTERALDRLGTADKPWEGWELRYSIESAPRSGSVVCRLDGAVVRRGGFRLGPLDLEIDWAERVVLLGPNGSGKTTLIGAVLGRLPLEAGARYLGPSVVVGELGQDRSARFAERRLLEIFEAESGLVTSEARTLLAKFGLGAAHVGRPWGTLSPGERTRAELARFQAIGVNLLVLDEPTNHLDLPAIEQLEGALAGFAGTLLLVSHDRRLLDAVELDRTVDVASLTSTRR